MSTNIRFMVYNAYGIGGTVKTIFNFADYFQKTGKYNVEIISIKRTKETPTLYLNPKVKITVIQDARRGAKFAEQDRALLGLPSELIDKEEDLYAMFNAYTDKRLKEVLGSLHDGVLVTTMPSFNVLATTMVDDRVLKIGQEHKSYADHTEGIQELIKKHYGDLDALTILTERNKHVYEKKIKGDLPLYVLGNGTERLNFKANLKNHIIVAAGRYAYQKGYDLLIEAFAIIADQFPDWIVKIYGEGTLAKDYIRLIHKYGLENRIVLEPGSDRMDEMLSEASIHVCSSYYEPFGMVVIEGFAMGLPCVSFACDGPREIITNGYDGLVVPKENVEELANAMAKVMADEQLRQELGNNAYETAKKYDIRKIGNNFEKLVEKELKLKEKRLKGKKAEEKNENKKVDEKQLPSQESIPYETYNEMVLCASNGRVGLKTIWLMFKGWIVFKVSGKGAQGEE